METDSYQEIDLMKKAFLIAFVILAFGMLAMAQIQAPTSDVLGAHLNYGRGCAACHAPHSGARGQGITTSDTTSGNVALWGQDVAPLFGKTIITGGTSNGSYTEVLPGTWDNTRPDTADTLTCLSCHDGNYAQGAMMKNQVYETVPSTYSSNNIPTLLGNDGSTKGNYLNDHPVGLNAIVGCGGQYNWDCTVASNGSILMNGPNSSQFVRNYGWFVSTAAYNSQPTVQCTTCHNQHLMNVVKVTNGPNSGLPSGYYATMFFVRAPYNPGSGTQGSNQTAQFCRQCHGGEGNESNGGTNIPTTF
jgi:formate-dependent nitrite reductase cytochrome c552 subunit